MSTTADVAAANEPEARQRRLRSRLRWVLFGLIVLVVAVSVAILQGSFRADEKRDGDPRSFHPNGYRALAQVLQAQGVDLEVTTSYERATELASGGGALVMTDTPALSDGTVRTLIRGADTVVFLSPSNAKLDLLFPGARSAPMDDSKVLGAQCDSYATAKNPRIAPTLGYISDEGAGCYRNEDAAGMLVSTDQGQTRVAIDGASLFTNHAVDKNDNAALGLTLLGSHERLVWYVPSLTDTDDARDFTPSGGIAELAPSWVRPLLVLAVVVVIASAIWRGRRFGPLVAERLPVTVRVSETMEGRAKLYARSSDTAHAARVLRTETTQRLRIALGMGSAAPLDSVIETVAASIGTRADLVGNILAGALPFTERDLMDLSDRLTQLEDEVRRVYGSQKNGPTS